MEPHDGQSDEADDHVEDDDGPAHLVPVARPAGGVHDDGGEGVGRRNEALRGADRVAHLLVQDDGQEVRQRVRHRRRVQEDHGVPPDLDVQRCAEEFTGRPGLGLRVAAVAVHPRDDILCFALRQEFPALVRLVREVDQRDVGADAQCHGQRALDDEDPPPSGQALVAGAGEGFGEAAGAWLAAELHQAVSEDTSARGCQTTQHVEDGVALSDVVARVPGGKEVDARGEEARFEDAQDDAQAGEGLPVFDEAHADHDGAP